MQTKASFISVLFIFLSLQVTFSQEFFELVDVGLPSIVSSQWEWGDYDNDGDLDLFSLNSDTNILKVFENNNGNFTQTNVSIDFEEQVSFSLNDYNNDGWVDLLLNSYKSNGAVYLNNQGVYQVFTLPSIAECENKDIAWADYDHDGDLDFAVVGVNTDLDPAIAVYNNNNDVFTMSAHLRYGFFSFNNQLHWIDFDSDGDLDLFLFTDSISSGTRQLEIYKNSNGSFSYFNGVGFITSASTSYGDYDNNGILDVIISGTLIFGLPDFGSLTTVLSYNESTDNLSSNTMNLPQLGGNTFVQWGDCDNDGDLDLTLSGTEDVYDVTNDSYNYLKRVEIYRNDNGTFNLLNLNFGNYTPNKLSNWADYDNDGDLDLIFTGKDINDNDIVRILKNNNDLENTIPTAPTNFTGFYNYDEQTVTFNWDIATDQETPSTGLSYNVFIKRDTNDYIQSPLSQENNGWRKIIDMGNTIQENSYTFKIPVNEDGSFINFIAKVQAIDHNYAGSPFSEEMILNMREFYLGTIIYVSENRTLSLTNLKTGKVSVKLYDLLGKEVYNIGFNAAVTNSVKLPDYLLKSAYIVNVETENGVIVKKILL